MEFNFKKFEGRNKRTEDRITVTKSYSIGLPTRYYSDNNIEKFKYAVLFWDSGKRAIGIRFTNDDTDKNRFSITHNANGYGGSIVARSFFRLYGIDPKKVFGRYEWSKYPIDGVGDVFVIQLKDRASE